MLTVAFAAIVATALLVPALASANWTYNGAELKKSEDGVQEALVWAQSGVPLSESGAITIGGRFVVSSASVGTIDCPVSASASLGTSGGSGTLSSFTISPAGCALSGFIASICTKVNSVTTAGEPWSFSATGTPASRAIAINGVNVTYKFACGSEMPLTFTGNLTATPDNADAIHSLSLSGTLKSGLGNVSVSKSSLSVSPSGQYGIYNQVTYQQNVALSGTLGWVSGLYGGMNCPVTGSLSFEAGTQGKLTSLNWNSASCVWSGLYKQECGSEGQVTSNSLPWTIVDQGSSIKITGASITYGTGKCQETWSGELTATPDKSGAISSTAVEGLLHAGGSSRTWSGSLGWTPAATYGL